MFNDDSEETQVKRQSLDKSIKDAEATLKETEWDRYIEDTSKFLQSLSDDAEEWVNERLDNIDLLIQMAVDATNQNAVTISDTIQKETEAVGYTLSSEMQTIWKSSDGLAATVTNGLDKSTTAVKDIVSVYGQDFQKRWTTTNDALNGIKVGIDALVKDANVKAQEKIKQAQAQQAKAQATVAKASTPAPKPASQPAKSAPAPAQSAPAQKAWGWWFKSKVDSYPKSKLEKSKDTSIVDRLKLRNIDSSMSARREYYYAMGGSGTYRGTASQNTWMIQEMRKHGYKKGSRNTTAGLHLFDEAGTEAIMTKYGKLRTFDNGETVFTKAMTDNLWELAKGNLPKFTSGDLSKLVKNTNTSSNNNIAYNITLPNVKNYDQFKSALIRDPQFEKSVTQMTIGNAMGGNTLKKLSF